MNLKTKVILAQWLLEHVNKHNYVGLRTSNLEITLDGAFNLESLVEAVYTEGYKRANIDREDNEYPGIA